MVELEQFAPTIPPAPSSVIPPVLQQEFIVTVPLLSPAYCPTIPPHCVLPGEQT